MTGKAVKIARGAYDALPKAKQMAVEKAKRGGNLELAQAIDAMGIGSFASYLISTELEKLRKFGDKPTGVVGRNLRRTRKRN